MKKKIKLERYEHYSLLGTKVFKNVTAWVYDDVDLNTFDPERDEYFMDDKEIMRLEKEVAKVFLKERMKSKNVDLTEDEVNGIRIILGLNASEFAARVGITKSTMSKILRGTIKMKRPECMLALVWLGKKVNEDVLEMIAA